MAYLTNEDQQRIDAIVDNIRMQTGLSYPGDSLVKIAKALGIEVYETKFKDYDNVDGLLEYPVDEKSKPKIYLNKERPAYRKTFTLAHEIGHYVMHKDAKVKYRIDQFDYSHDNKTTKEETEANYFAATLLVPEDKLRIILKAFENNIDAAVAYFRVSKPVIENRVKWLKTNHR